MCAIILITPFLIFLANHISPTTGMGVLDVNKRWPHNTVPYEIGPYNQNDVNLIKQAMNELQSKTCIRFVEHTNEKNYMKIEEDPFLLECSSLVGMANIGMQALYLRSPSCMHLHTITHEFLHILGFEHMHASSDRDDYIVVDYTNILPANHIYFKTVDPAYFSYFGTSYDPASVMHYRSDDFAIDRTRRTIYGKTPEINSQIDGNMLSQGDITRVNNMYNCPGYYG